MFYGYYEWAPYVSVGEKIAKARTKMAKLAKKGLKVQPIEKFGGAITKTFWGKAWCRHIESFQEVSNRLYRGRSYVRNGSVCHLAIEPGKVIAHVAGSKPYEVEINVKTLPAARWKRLKSGVIGQVDSLFDLLQGKISNDVMAQLADAKNGLFPRLGELKYTCSCPDARFRKNWMCKHIAAVFYGIARRFETDPELLFTLRGVESRELIGARAEAAIEQKIEAAQAELKNDELENIFGIELAPSEKKKTRQKKIADQSTQAVKKTPAKKTPAKQTPVKQSPAKQSPAKQTPVKKKIDGVLSLKQIALERPTTISMKIATADREKIKKAAQKTGLGQNAFLVARLKEYIKSKPGEMVERDKLKRTRKSAGKDAQLIITLKQSEKNQIKHQAKREKKPISQFVFDLLFE